MEHNQPIKEKDVQVWRINKSIKNNSLTIWCVGVPWIAVIYDDYVALNDRLILNDQIPLYAQFIQDAVQLSKECKGGEYQRGLNDDALNDKRISVVYREL